MKQLEPEASEELGPSSLSAREILSLPKVREILVVRTNLNLVCGSLEIVPPGVKSPNNGQEFLVVDVVVPFGFR